MATFSPTPAPPSIQDITGQRFGRLFVLGYGGRRTTNHLWLCQCDCGDQKLAQAGNMRAGLTQSCGCLQKERASAARSSPNLPKPAKSHPEYKVWSEMNRRCYNPADMSFRDYGGRGVTVHPAWRFGEGDFTAFECFIRDLGPRPSKDHSLERDDNEQGYNPTNCYWATRQVQGRNKRNNVRVQYQGQERLILEVCEETGVPVRCATQRLARGWSVEDAVTIPSKQPGKRKSRKQR